MGDTSIADVVRARRYELVDENDKLRAVVGRLDEHDYPTYGLALVADDGETYRAEFSIDPGGVGLTIELGGNEVVRIGVSDPGEDANRVGAFLTLADLGGQSVFHWHVHDDGRVVGVFGVGSR